MTAFVLDASTALSWCLSDEVAPYGSRVFAAVRDGADVHVPHIWPLEVTNVLVKALRQRRITLEELGDYARRLSLLDVEVHAEAITRRAFGEVLDLARRHQLSTYDASYVELARRLGLPIATADANLLQAARALRTPIFQP